ncbi:hypothetical protein DXG01_014018 [Tephrocybe rancida]|nr:hypothetical protein DXG01_014018 [Tephrocybe rancida]
MKPNQSSSSKLLPQKRTNTRPAHGTKWPASSSEDDDHKDNDNDSQEEEIEEPEPRRSKHKKRKASLSDNEQPAKGGKETDNEGDQGEEEPEEEPEEELEEVEIEDLNDRHSRGIPSTLPVKKDSTRDLLLIFSDRTKQDFVNKSGNSTILEGRWCLVCKAAYDSTLKDGHRPSRPLNKCFLQGANTTCRGHIMRFHFEEYEQRCNAAIPNILMNHACVPPAVQKEHEEGDKQKKLAFNVVKGPAEFTRLGVLESVAKHTAVDNQALILADKISFRNCLTSMRPKSKSADLPSTHDVSVYIHNAFVMTLDKLKADIEKAPGKVSCTADSWTADTTKLGYLGMTAHWIDIDEFGCWKLRAEVVGFQLIHGTHAGSNLGRYFVGLCDRVGIMSHTHSKAINLFVIQADQLYGPIMTQRTNGRVTKKIPWTDFILNDSDWKRVEEAKTIMMDLNRVLHYFSAEKQPTLYHAIPAIKNLQMAWEDKLSKLVYALYHDAIRDGLAKLLKYYS